MQYYFKDKSSRNAKDRRIRASEKLTDEFGKIGGKIDLILLQGLLLKVISELNHFEHLEDQRESNGRPRTINTVRNRGALVEIIKTDPCLSFNDLAVVFETSPPTL